MAYSDDTVLSKLSALNETQEGIVTAANWILFHRYGMRISVYPFIHPYKKWKGERRIKKGGQLIGSFLQQAHGQENRRAMVAEDERIHKP